MLSSVCSRCMVHAVEGCMVYVWVVSGVARVLYRSRYSA
jgi:hypothetical protein